MRRRNQGNSSRSDEVAEPWRGDEPAGYYPQPTSIRQQAEEILNLLFRRKWIILAICVLVVAAGAYHTLSQTPIYESSGLVMISDRSMQEGVQRDGEETDLFARSNRSVENELLLLRNSSTIRTVVAERLLEKDVLPDTDRPIPVTRTAEGEKRAVGEVASRLSGMVSFASAGRDARVIQMTGRSSEPREAALVANLFMDEYVNLTQRSSRAKMTSTREFLEDQVQQRYEELDDVEGRIQEYMRQEGAVALDGEGSRLISRIADVESRRDAAEIELSQRRSTIESKQEELESISPRLADRIASGIERDISATQDRITEAEQARQELRQRDESQLSESERARIDRLTERIERYRDEARQMSESYVEEVLSVGGVGLSAGEGLTHVTALQREIVDERIAISGLEAEMNLLENRLAQYEAELETLPAQARELAQMEREQAYLEGVYRGLVEQLQEVRMQEQTELGYADRVNEAFIPGRPSSPDVQRNLMLAVLMGLLLGVGGAFLRDRLDNRLYKPEQVREAGYRLLSVVPDLTPFRKEKFEGSEYVSFRDHTISSALVSSLTASAAPAEAYRHLRTNLQFCRPDSMLQVVMVTSPGMGDGKSVSAANLAVTMAQAGRRTLLLDADLRRPQVHTLFGMERSPGLSNHLKQGAESTLALQRTIEPHLYALPAGDPVGNPSELLGSPAFRNALAALKEHFDFIVIDTPPVLVATDATLLSTQCDGTIMVARAATTTEPELEESLATLEDVGSTVDGILFNAFKVSMAFGYKLRYRHYATYGHYGQYTSDASPEDTDEPSIIRV